MTDPNKTSVGDVPAPDDHALHTQLGLMAKLKAEHTEEIRVFRWHATYNAALTGLYAKRSDRKDPSHHEIDIDARIAADIAHGALK